MNVFPASMYVDHTYVWCLWRSVRRLRFPGSVSHHMGPANWTQVLYKSSKCSSLVSCRSRPHIKVGIFLSPGEDSWRFSNSSDSNWEFYHSYLPPSTQSMLQISRLPPIRTPALNSGPPVLLTMKLFINHGFQWSPPRFQELFRMNQELKKALCIQFLVYIKEYNSSISKWGRCTGQSTEVNVRDLCLLQVHHALLIHIPNQNAIISSFL